MEKAQEKTVATVRGDSHGWTQTGSETTYEMGGIWQVISERKEQD